MSYQDMFKEMRRAGFGAGMSKSRLAKAMLEILVQLPKGTQRLKETVVAHLGMLGQVCATRDINAAWNEAKQKAAREYPDKFFLDGRKVLHWDDGSVKFLDKKISSANFKKLNELAEAQGCTVNQLISKLIKKYQSDKR